MATKKTSRSKGNRLKQSATFPSPNPEGPLSLTEIVDRMEDDPAFAKFISTLLCDSYSDEKARENLASYYKPTTTELTDLCIPKSIQKATMLTCTVPTTTNFLIAIPAQRCSIK
jgi:hypothetical protein